MSISISISITPNAAKRKKMYPLTLKKDQLLRGLVGNLPNTSLGKLLHVWMMDPYRESRINNNIKNVYQTSVVNA
jgi:hypothetical protein